MHKKLSVVAAAVLAVAAAGTASAHTISIGVYNAGGPGSVTLAMGTYGPGHSGPIFQGAMALIAGPSTTGPVSFASVATVLSLPLCCAALVAVLFRGVSPCCRKRATVTKAAARLLM